MKLLVNKENIMIKNLIAVCICFFIFSPLFAKLTEKELTMLAELDIEQYQSILKKFQKTYQEQQNNKTPETIKYTPIKRQINLYAVHPFVTADTGIKAKWFVKINEAVTSCLDAMREEEVALKLKNKKSFIENKKLAESAYSKFEEYAKKPPKEKSKVVKSLQKKARSVRKDLQKKFDAEFAKEEELKKKKNKKHKKKKHKKKKNTK